MNLFDFHFSELNENDKLGVFDCGEEEINRFLKEDALNFQSEKMTNTFVFKNELGNVVIFFPYQMIVSMMCVMKIVFGINFIEKLNFQIIRGSDNIHL